MKYIISLILFISIVILSCNTGKQKGIFSTNTLPAQKFTINTESDTVLQTENGALLKIPAGALQNKTGTTVTLEIKEAYSLQQIIKAGLLTQSNGEPLSSGGMIYINASAGQEVIFKQKIQVALPADFLQEGMQLYKGKETTDGSINWENPDTLPQNKQLTAIEKGKLLFESSCSSCHAIGHSSTGPDLAHFPRRIPYGEGSSFYWYHDFALKYIPRLIDINSGKIELLYSRQWSDPYACNLINLFNKPVNLNITTDTAGADIFDIYDYIQNESDRLNLPLPPHAYLKGCTDSCYEYSTKIKELQWQKSLSQQERERLIKENGEMTKVIPDTTWRVSQTPGPPPDFDKKVSPRNFDATYYQFSVESFGWYNIDMLLSKVNNGVIESELFVSIVGEYRERVNIFLIIPSVKVYAEGGPAEDGDKYAFHYKNGKIPLPQNTKAYILAVTEQNEKIAFSLKEFTTSTQQEFSIALQTATKEKFEAALKDFDTGRLHLKVNDSKNARSIRKSDQEIRDIDLQLKNAEKLKPKNCDCDCGNNSVVDTTGRSESDYVLASAQ